MLLIFYFSGFFFAWGISRGFLYRNKRISIANKRITIAIFSSLSWLGAGLLLGSFVYGLIEMLMETE
jgi:hypothetical protein